MKTTKMKDKCWQRLGVASVLLLLVAMIVAPLVIAQTPPAPSSTDIATFNQVLQPVWKVYNFVKYIATAIAFIVLLLAGIKYIMSGNEAVQRENAKHMVGYAILGLIIIWVTPFVVQMFTS